MLAARWLDTYDGCCSARVGLRLHCEEMLCGAGRHGGNRVAARDGVGGLAERCLDIVAHKGCLSDAEHADEEDFGAEAEALHATYALVDSLRDVSLATPATQAHEVRATVVEQLKDLLPGMLQDALACMGGELLSLSGLLSRTALCLVMFPAGNMTCCVAKQVYSVLLE